MKTAATSSGALLAVPITISTPIGSGNSNFILGDAFAAIFAFSFTREETHMFYIREFVFSLGDAAALIHRREVTLPNPSVVLVLALPGHHKT
jgi:hypothetical protein